eukprot:TRINITY_DN12403_c0_g1_i3.p1 TRINITY_DN12403_c0_g1~~TRINITY_DN12403_c0_g1_i3.p1  ORF type:complete len:312 (+),score=83.96 TRINITY_DN12403_c0_g1_i3:268-1203(+)
MLPKRKKSVPSPRRRNSEGMFFPSGPSPEEEDGREEDQESISPDGKGEMSGYYGEWQVESYDPGKAENGKVPTNQYGNVYLFTLSMMPRGCTLIKLDNALAVSKKLKISCAPAMVGWHHGRYTRPILEGCVVCKEDYPILFSACIQDYRRKREEEKEKRLNMALCHWKSLYHKILMRERVNETYLLPDHKRKKNSKDVDVESNKQTFKEKGEKRTREDCNADLICGDENIVILDDSIAMDSTTTSTTINSTSTSTPSINRTSNNNNNNNITSTSTTTSIKHIHKLREEVDPVTGILKKICLCGYSMACEQL